MKSWSFTLFFLLVSFSLYSQQDNKKKIIAIYPFSSYASDYYQYATTVGTAVETGFVKSTRFVVVERGKFGQIKGEDQFREANTSDVVAIASKFGANTVVLGHVVGVSTNSARKKEWLTDNYYTEYTGNISFTLKLVDVETSEIKVAESMSLSGTSRDGGSAALGAALGEVDEKIQQFINAYFPQRFLFMEVTDLDPKRNAVKEFKIWAGSENGIKTDDIVEIYELSFMTHPVTGKDVESKELIGEAKIIAINGASVSTCKMLSWSKNGKRMQSVLTNKPDNLVLEFTGTKKDFLFKDSFQK